VSGELGDGHFYGAIEDQASAVQVLGVGGVGTLSGVASLTAGGSDFCALLVSGGVDCWGFGSLDGELGNGTTSDSATPVPVVGVGGVGTLSGVVSLTDDDSSGFCAVLDTGGVDCWGGGTNGELGNGQVYATGGSATPVQVVGVGGVGTLSGVVSLSSTGGGLCALLTTSGVDCWGVELGNGQSSNSGTPVQVEGVGGVGTLTDVAFLATDDEGYCAVLGTGGVDCWGDGFRGQLGDGSFHGPGLGGSSTPVQVEGVGGTGTLSGVASVQGGSVGFYCALLTSGGVDCWGDGYSGELGNGVLYPSSTYGSGSGSATPVQVEGVGGAGTLSDVASIVTNEGGSCVILNSGGIDCWGGGVNGQLGDGNFYATGHNGSATPVQVMGVGSVGLLAGVTSLASSAGLDTFAHYCAVLTTTGAICWGNGTSGNLGDDFIYTTGNKGSAIPVQVVTPPTAVLIPSPNAAVSGTQVLDATARSGATQVEYELESHNLSQPIQVIATGTPTYYGWLAQWNTATLPNGSYTLWGVGSYPNGETGLSAPISITVDNPPPTSTVLIPTAGASVSGSSSLLDASASRNATSVAYEISGGSLINQIVAKGTPTYYGWLAQWNTTTVPNGTYSLVSVATAPNGDSTTSTPLSISVANAPPTTAVLVPSNGTSQSGTTAVLDARASSNVTTVTYELTGGTLTNQVIATGTPTLYGWLAEWNTTTVPDGTYSLQSVAAYAGGVSGTSAPITITVSN
jgi:hypothetical protein